MPAARSGSRARRQPAWRSCSPGAVFTGTNGGPKAKAPTWSWARCCIRSTISGIGWCSSEVSTTPRRSRATSIVHKPATFSPARRWPPAGGFSPAPASINLSRSTLAIEPSCRVSCLAVKRRTPPCTRITRCCTARTSRGAARPRQRRSKSTRHWRSTRCSRTRHKPVTGACSMPCCRTRRICAATSAGSTSKNSTNTSTPFARWKCESRAPASAASCRAGGRPWPSPTCRARETATRRTSSSTCAS